MAKLYFIGGEDVRNRDLLHVHGTLLQNCPGGSVLVFPWTAPPSEKSKLWMDICRSFFLDSGAGKVHFADLGSSAEHIAGQIGVSDLLYLPGGDPRLLADNLRAKGLASAIGAFQGVVAGNSAGAMVMARRAIHLRGQDDEPETSISEGLALADITVSVHYGAKKRLVSGIRPDDDLAALSHRVGGEILAIPETSAVIVEGGVAAYFGDVFAFRAGRRFSVASARC